MSNNFKAKYVLGLVLSLSLIAAGCNSSQPAMVQNQLPSQTQNTQPPINSTPSTPAIPKTPAPNGYYYNKDGNLVPSPYQAPSAPAGASARCGDGSYSFSQHRQGTCSHHGGVAEWLN